MEGAWVSLYESMSERGGRNSVGELLILHHNVPEKWWHKTVFGARGREPRKELWPKARKEKPGMLFYADRVHCAARQRCKHDHTDGSEREGTQGF